MNQRFLDALDGRYTIERELGGGGMSRVFIAHESGLGRAVVIKVIAPELAGEVSAERFAREVKLAARLQQANIVPLLSAGEAEGVPYYTMPFVRGESLRARIARGDRVPLLEAIGILRDVARALSYAHGEGVIHRDIKPENILISGGTAVVTDFGIAKALSASRTMDGAPVTPSGITQVGSSIGTPAYMAPEQAAGDPEADHRIDIYAWGVIAWELLGGRHPFATKTSPQALLAAHMAEKPEALTSVATQVPPQLSALVARCLEKDPAKRPTSATELIAQLDSVTTPSATGDSVSRPAARSSRRFALYAAAAIVLIAASFGMYLSSRGGADTGGTARSIVVIPFENLGAASDEYFADGVTEEIAGRLARIPGLQVVARASVKKFRGSTTPPQEIARQLGAAYALSGTVRWARAPSGAPTDATVRIVPSLVLASTGAQVWGEPLQENLADVFKAQADIAERVANALSVTIDVGDRDALRRPESSDPEARDAVLLGFRLIERRGPENIRQAMAQFDRAIARDSLYARAWAGRSQAHGLLQSYFATVDNETAMATAELSARRALALDSLLPEAHVALATAVRASPREALRAADRAIELDPGSAMAFTRRATLLMLLGRVAEAEAPFRRAITLDPLVGAYTARLGWWYMATGKMDSAVFTLRRAVELDPLNTVLPYLGALMYAHAGRLEDAVTACAAFSGNAARCRDLWSGLVDPRQGNRALAILHERGRNGGEPIVTDAAFRAIAYSRLGATDSAFAALREMGRNNISNAMAFINSPWFKPLHDDPRWDQIVGAMRRR